LADLLDSGALDLMDIFDRKIAATLSRHWIINLVCPAALLNFRDDRGLQLPIDA
jgi:hypothetical protein